MAQETYVKTIMRRKLIVNAIQINRQIIPYRQFDRAVGKTLKIMEKFLYGFVSEFYQVISRLTVTEKEVCFYCMC